MINIAVSQIKNSVNIEKNFSSIKKSLNLIENTDADIVLFPECALSGFSSKIKDYTPTKIQPYLDQIKSWSCKTGITVILPTAIFDFKAYNTGYIFNSKNVSQFFKIGLTDSEKNFFSKPDIPFKKVFEIKGHKLAILICFEAQMNPHEFFNTNEVDIILWPGYWGWNKGATWGSSTEEGKDNLIYKNMKTWNKPLIQSNFAFNNFGDEYSKGPHGLSMFVNSDNKLFGQGEYEKEACYKITIENGRIQDFNKIGDLP